MIPSLNGQGGFGVTQFMSGHLDALEDIKGVVGDVGLCDHHLGAVNANHLLGNCLIQLGELERASDHLK